MATGIRPLPRFPGAGRLGLHRTPALLASAALVLAFAGPGPLRAQSADSPPQEPDWTAASPGTSDPTASERTDPAETRPAPTAVEPAPKSPAAEPLLSTSSDRTASGTPPPLLSATPSGPSSDVGVPKAGNWNLPDLTDPMDPFFQMEGLHMRLGMVEFFLTYGMSFEYNDNIFNVQKPRTADYITTISPTFTLEVGDAVKREDNFAAISYQPQPQIFAENSDQTTINENLQLALQYKFPRLTENLSFGYIKDSNPTASDIGRVEYRLYNLNWANSYAIGARTAFEAELRASATDYNSQFYTNYSTTSVAVQLAYEASAKLALTLGPYMGLTRIEGGSDQVFEGIRLGFRYDSLKKLSFHGSLGAQALQYRGTNAGNNEGFSTPTFALGLTYLATPKRTLTLDLARSTQNSGSANGQVYINTTASVGITQIFFRSWNFALRLGYNALAYQGSNNDHTDTYVTFSPSLGYSFWQDRCLWSIYYTRTQRFSDIEAYQFDANVLGTRINIQF
jgi:hypothetical protein